MTTRESRLTLGWALAVAAALLLVLSSVRPAPAPEVAGAAASPTPPAQAAYAPDPLDRLLHSVPRLLPVDQGAGSAYAGELAPLTAEQAAALQAVLERVRTQFHLDTLAIGISLPGGLGWTGAAGVGHDGATPITADSPFVIASITKTFTAALILQLVEEGSLSLDAEVRQLLPGVAVPAGVTIEQLLRHTSGIADLLRPLRPVLNNDTEHSFQPAEVVAAVGPVWWAPGANWGYSNTNYVLLGMVVEQVTGATFAEALESRLLTPLHLDRSGMLGQPDAPWLMPPAWVTAFWTSGSMYATANDLLRWGEALYDGGVLEEDSRMEMLSFGEHPYGLGAEFLKVGDRPAYGHSGLLRGFTSLLVHLPADGVTFVLLSTGPRYDPADLLSAEGPGKPSLLDLALGDSPFHPVGELR